MLNKLFISALFLFVIAPVFSQNYRINKLDSLLNVQTVNHPGLDELIDLKVDGLSVVDFVRGIGQKHKLNITIQESIQGDITTSFFNAKIKDVFINLCQEYNLDIEFIGTVINFKKYVEPKIETVVEKKDLVVSYNDSNTFLSFNFSRDSLLDVVKTISLKTGKNVLCDKNINNELITGYIQNRPIEVALNNLATINNLDLEITSDDFYIFKKLEQETTISKNNVNRSAKGNSSNNRGTKANNFSYSITNGMVNIEADNISLGEILSSLLIELKQDFVFYDVPTELISVYVDNMTKDEFFDLILKGTKYSMINENNRLLIGIHKSESLMETKLIQLKNRTIEKALDLLPPLITKDLFIKEYPTLNGYIVNGSELKIKQLEQALLEIDKITPMVLIEVMIIESLRSNSISGGISTGITTTPNPSSSSGSITPGVNVQLGTSTINDIINSINGFGAINLGNVGPNFFMNIEALESNQILKVESVPKLATLNSETANLSIGATEYYVQQNTNLITVGAGNQNVLQSQEYKPVNADLTIDITPFVSGDEQVTLKVNVSQSDFTARISDNAPPGNVSRSFKSVIRIKNGDVILLGGLEEKSRNNSGNGIPFLARIPVIKWFFGKRIKEKRKSTLSILIRATVSY